MQEVTLRISRTKAAQSNRVGSRHTQMKPWIGGGPAVVGGRSVEQTGDLRHAVECKRRSRPNNQKAEPVAWIDPTSQ
jgi:hypothetical protein